MRPRSSTSPSKTLHINFKVVLFSCRCQNYICSSAHFIPFQRRPLPPLQSSTVVIRFTIILTSSPSSPLSWGPWWLAAPAVWPSFLSWAWGRRASRRVGWPECEHGCAGVGEDDCDYDQNNHIAHDEDVDDSHYLFPFCFSFLKLTEDTHCGCSDGECRLQGGATWGQSDQSNDLPIIIIL